MNWLRYIILSLCAIADTGLLIFGISGVLIYVGAENPNVPPAMVISWTAGSFAMLALTISSFVRTIRGRGLPVVMGFLLKIPVAFLVLGISWFALGIPEAGWLAVILTAFMLGLILLLAKFSTQKKSDAQKQSGGAPGAGVPSFWMDKAEWAWDSAAAEYFALQGQLRHPDTEEGRQELMNLTQSMPQTEIDRIYSYAGSPIAYYLGWLISRDLVSEAFQNLHSPEELRALKEERKTPGEVLQDMDYVLTREDIKKEALLFTDLYYNPEYSYRPLQPDRPMYFLDYYTTVCRGYDRPRYYCTDFSWLRFRELAELLDRRFREFNYSFLDEEYMESDGRYLVSPWFNVKTELCYEPGTPADYVELCARSFENMGEKLRLGLSEHMLEYCTDELSEDDLTSEKVLARFQPFKLVVMNPGAERTLPAYVLLGESEWEEEHGISFTIIDDCVVYSGYYADAESPWKEDLLWQYRIRKDAETGSCCTIRLIPERFSSTDSEIGQIRIPVSAAIRKEQIDQMVDALFLLKLADRYDCRITCDNDVPNYMFITASKGGKGICTMSIPLR